MQQLEGFQYAKALDLNMGYYTKYPIKLNILYNYNNQYV